MSVARIHLGTALKENLRYIIIQFFNLEATNWSINITLSQSKSRILQVTKGAEKAIYM